MQGIAKNFREVFSELATNGKGELVMQKAQRKERALDPEEDTEGNPSTSAHEQFSGVKVKVRSCRSKDCTRESIAFSRLRLNCLPLRH